MSDAPPEPGAGRALGTLACSATDIEEISLARVRAAATVPLPPPPGDAVALRMAYAAGDPTLLADIVVDAAAVRAVAAALAEGRSVLCDSRMLSAGARAAVAACGGSANALADLAAGDAAPAATVAATMAAARTATAARLVACAGELGGCACLALGTAPSAVLALLDLLADGCAPPPAVIATCCGLVAATEAKDLLLTWRERLGVPVIAVRGSRGGAAVAAAAVNACARLALSEAAPRGAPRR